MPPFVCSQVPWVLPLTTSKIHFVTTSLSPFVWQVAVRTYAVRVLPLADYTMINSINPVIVIRNSHPNISPVASFREVTNNIDM